MISIDLKPGQKLQIGDAIVTLEQKSGQLARLVIDADRSIPVKKMKESDVIGNGVFAQGLMTT
jgi:hypothetical protein